MRFSSLAFVLRVLRNIASPRVIDGDKLLDSKGLGVILGLLKFDQGRHRVHSCRDVDICANADFAEWQGLMHILC